MPTLAILLEIQNATKVKLSSRLDDRIYEVRTGLLISLLVQLIDQNKVEYGACPLHISNRTVITYPTIVKDATNNYNSLLR